jgi:hypothetical protein
VILVQACFTLLIAGPILLGAAFWHRNRSLPAPSHAGHRAALLNSAVLYALAFNIVFFLQELFLVLGKKSLGLVTYLYHNNHSWEGTDPRTALMQGTGALAIFVFGVLCLAWFRHVRRATGIWKVLLLWLAFQGLMQSVPQLMVASFAPDTDVGQALVGYLHMHQSLVALLAVLSMVATAGISAWFATPVLELSPSGEGLDNPKARLRYVRDVAVGGALVGSALVVPFRVPPATQAVAPFLLMLFSLPWLWVAAARVTGVETIPNAINDRLRWEPAALLVLLLLVFRFVLAPGVRF